MTIKRVEVHIDENLDSIYDESKLSVRVGKNDEILGHITALRDADPQEISDELHYTVRGILENRTLNPKDRRDKYELYMEAASNVPGLKK